MKRFSFSLEKVLKFRERQQWLAEIRQKKMADAVRSAEAETESLVEQLNNLCRWLYEKADRAQDARVWMSMHTHTVRVEQAIDAARQKAVTAMHHLDRAAAERKLADIEVEKLCKLRQRKWEEFSVKLQRAEQEQLDEISCARWFAAKRIVDGGEKVGGIES